MILNLFHKCIFINIQASGDSCQEFQRVKLRLFRKTDRTFGFKRQRQIFRKFCRKAKGIHRANFLFDGPSVPFRIDICAFFLKITLYFSAQLTVFFQSFLICPQIKIRLLFSKIIDKSLIDQTMLGRDFCRGILGNSAAYGFSLHKHIIHSRVFQKISTQNAAQSASDDQYIRSGVTVQRFKFRHFNRICPDRLVHMATLPDSKNNFLIYRLPEKLFHYTAL